MYSMYMTLIENVNQEIQSKKRRKLPKKLEKRPRNKAFF